jgi:hypothetical protein
MSIGQNHVFRPLTKDSTALADDQRLVRLIAKGKNKHENLQQSLCVSIPALTSEHVVEYIDALLPYVVGMVADTQDKIIREYRIESGADSINEQLFDVPHCIEWLADNATGERLTKEAIREWALEEYSDAGISWLATLPKCQGLGQDELARRWSGMVGILEQFADPRATPAIPQLRAVISFAESMECDTRLTTIANRAAKMLEKATEELDFL